MINLFILLKEYRSRMEKERLQARNEGTTARTRMPDPVLEEAFDRIEDTWRNSRSLIESAYCRIDEESRTILPGDQKKPALVVPIDHDAVIPRSKKREAFAFLSNQFAAQIPRLTVLSAELVPLGQLCQASDNPTDDVSPFWNNLFFTGMDAKMAYALTRHRKPHRIVEIGSGNSTRFFRKAIQDGKLSTRLVSIDPSPRIEVAKVADEVIQKSVQDVELDVFARMVPGDILFYDGSHLCFHGSDVTDFFLRVLPAVPAGVMVHVHDIWLPYEYPPHFDTRYYNEQYLLGAFLMYNSSWSVSLPIHFLFEKGVIYEDGGSFWMERTS